MKTHVVGSPASLLPAVSGRLAPAALGDARPSEDDDAMGDIACQLHTDVVASEGELVPHIFFKVLSPRPYLIKGISYGSGVCEGFRSDELSVVVMHAFRDVVGNVCVKDIDVTMRHGVLRSHAVVSLPWCERADMWHAVYQWQVIGGEQRFSWRGLPPGIHDAALCNELAMAMFEAGAFTRPGFNASPFICEASDVARSTCLRELSDVDYVTCVRAGEGEDTHAWVFTQQGLDQLRLVHGVWRPTPCLQTRPLTPLASMTLYQVLDTLLSTGWELRPVARKALLSRQAPHTPDATKTLYMVAGTTSLPRHYLLAMADVDNIFGAGVLQIRHGGVRTAQSNPLGHGPLC